MIKVNYDNVSFFINPMQERGLLKNIVELELDPIAKRAASLAFNYIDMGLPDNGLEQLTLLAESNGWGINLNAPDLKNGSYGWYNKKAEKINNQKEVQIQICSQRLSAEETLFELFRQVALAEMYWKVIGSFKPASRRFYFNKIFPKVNKAFLIVADKLKSPQSRSRLVREFTILDESFKKESSREAMFDSYMANA
jgi:hypothetical protein